MSKRKLKDFVGPRQKARRVRRFVEEHFHLTDDEVFYDNAQTNAIYCNRTVEVENIPLYAPVWNIDNRFS